MATYCGLHSAILIIEREVLMGYCYGYDQRTGKHKLACDNCGTIVGVRKRICPYRVTDSGFLNQNGRRISLPYCTPHALCANCYASCKNTLHSRCAEAAARSQASYDHETELLNKGEFLVISRAGDWHADVSPGNVGVWFKNKEGVEVFHQFPSSVSANTLSGYQKLFPK